MIYITTLSDLKRDLSKSIIIAVPQSHIWELYYHNGDYIKNLSEEYIEEKTSYYCLLSALKQAKKHPQIAEVQDIYGSFENFSAYRVEKKPGDSLFQVDPQTLFSKYPTIACQFQDIFAYAEREKIVFTDLFTQGNVLYAKNTDQISLIDVDSFQVGPNEPPFFHGDFAESIWNGLFDTEKYHAEKGYKPELNIFFFYELFFRIFFHQSLLKLRFQYLPNRFLLSTETYWSMVFEKRLCQFLKDLGFSKRTNLFSRIIDLTRDTPNSISAQDFQKMEACYQLEEKFLSGRLVRKK